MMRLHVSFIAFLVTSLAVVGCTPAAPPPTPTTAPVAPTKAAVPTKAAEPTKAVEPTKAPTARPTAVPARTEFRTKGKTITLVVPWGPGGSPDLGARILGAELEKTLGVPIAILNKGGAGSQVGLTELARAKPDGYTIGLTMHPTTNTTYLDATRQSTYDRRSFQPIVQFNWEPYLVVTLPNSPFKTPKDMVDAAKASATSVRIAEPGILTGQHIASLQWAELGGVEFSYVHFDAGPQMVAAIVGQHVEAGTFAFGGVMEQVRTGALRVVGIMDKDESKFFPGVKTFEAQGYKVYGSHSHGLTAAAGTPKSILDVYSGAVKQALQTPSVVDRLEQLGRISRFMDTAEYEGFWDRMDADLTPVVHKYAKK